MKRPRFVVTRLTLAALGLLVTLATTKSAWAIEDYPEAVQQALDMPCVPQCTLCHRDNTGGRGTIVKPFGGAMVANGLTDEGTQLISPALRAMQQQRLDSDGDGVGNIQELREGRDPNTPGDYSVCGPEYGCSVIAVRAASHHRVFIVLGTILVLAVARRGTRTAVLRTTSHRKAKRRS